MTIQALGAIAAPNIGRIGGVAANVCGEAAGPAPQTDHMEFSSSESVVCHNRSGIFQVMMPASMICHEKAPEVSTSSASGVMAVPAKGASESEIAAYCNSVAKSDAPLSERTSLIIAALSQGIDATKSPQPEWEKATADQVALYVQETLEHVDSVRGVGQLRGLDFNEHDLEVGTGKFEPSIAQFLAKPGRSEDVKWAIQKHNSSPHHATWNDKNSTTEELAESASDIVNAWRMNRRVYDKPSWSWERIASVIESQFQYNDLTVNQRDALLEAIPYQMEYENQHGLPA